MIGIYISKLHVSGSEVQETVDTTEKEREKSDRYEYTTNISVIQQLVLQI